MKRRIFWVTVLYMVVLLFAPPALSFVAAFVWIGYLTSVVLYALWNVPRGRKAAQHRRHLETSYARHRLSAARRATVLDDKGPEGHD